MKLKEKFKDHYICKKQNGKWSFYDENNRLFKYDYDSIEKAVDALYKYIELEDSYEHEKFHKMAK